PPDCAAAYLTASRPPGVAGARPSSRSSARYFTCASMAAALGANVTGAGAGLGSDAVVAHAATAAATRVTLRIGCDPRDGGPKQIRLIHIRQGVIISTFFICTSHCA